MRTCSRAWALVAPVVLLACALLPGTSLAFKPYTHVHAASEALEDVLDDGSINIAGRDYAVDPELVAALRFFTAHYNAGVVGPDGFPDLTMGQSIIHPENTGDWLRFILKKAKEAQSSSAYTADEKRQILAFSYGFLTHAAGDLWAHTMVNEFAREIFPGVKSVVTNPDSAAVALRHVVVEGYIGDATPGWDANPDRGPAPGGDVSDDSTPGIDFAAPGSFIYDTLVRRNNGSPSNARGPLLDFFLDLRASLATELGAANPDPLGAAISSYDDLYDRLAEVECACNFGFDGVLGAPCCDGTAECIADAVTDVVECPAQMAIVGFTFAAESFEAFFNFATESIDLALDAIKDAYIAAWIDDIDDGLKEWDQVGMALTNAFFDPQTRRDLQNLECASYGDEGSALRADCESGIGLFGVITHEIDPFINSHLLSMVGFPDVVGDARATLQEINDIISDFLDSVFGPALNPIRAAKLEVREYVEGLIKDFIRQRFGFDIDEMVAYWESPSSKMDLTDISLTLPTGTQVGVEFFRPTDHALLDSYLGIDSDHHDGPGGGLGDDVVFDPQVFAPYRNAVTMSKLVLLDGDQLDAVLGDLTGHPIRHYSEDPQANIMTTPFPTGTEPSTEGQWLASIDADHSWRANRQPFLDTGASPGHDEGFPLWASCVLREPAFRVLFADWENGDDVFPDLGDHHSHDLVHDPNAPTSDLVEGSPVYVDGAGTDFVTGATPITVDLADDYWYDDEVWARTAIRPSGGSAEPTVVRADGDVFKLDNRADGIWYVALEAYDSCRTEEAAVDATYVVDNTAPVVIYQNPRPQEYDTSVRVQVAFTASDGALGSGVQVSTTTFDDAAVANDYMIDMFYLWPGTHEVEVTSIDNLGNTSMTSVAFVLRATAASLANNVNRAYSEGFITRRGTYNSLSAIIDAARRAHDTARFGAELNQLGAFVNMLEAQRGSGIDEETANRFIAYARDLIENPDNMFDFTDAASFGDL